MNILLLYYFMGGSKNDWCIDNDVQYDLEEKVVAIKMVTTFYYSYPKEVKIKEVWWF